jgi:hypothetical protein
VCPKCAQSSATKRFVYSARVPLPGINHFEQGYCTGQAVVVPEPVVQSEANCSCKRCGERDIRYLPVIPSVASRQAISERKSPNTVILAG